MFFPSTCSGVGLLTATVTLVKLVPACCFKSEQMSPPASSVQPKHLSSALASQPYEAKARQSIKKRPALWVTQAAQLVGGALLAGKCL
eukprot:6183237-Pleurochrysis_carterae.AAC.6